MQDLNGFAVVDALRFDIGDSETSEEIFRKFGFIIEVERRPFGDVFLKKGETILAELNSGDWVTSGGQVISSEDFLVQRLISRYSLEKMSAYMREEETTSKSINPLKERFTYHPPKPGQTELYETIRNEGFKLAEVFNALAPESREKALAITKLEEAIFWINASIARHGEEVVNEG